MELVKHALTGEERAGCSADLHGECWEARSSQRGAWCQGTKKVKEKRRFYDNASFYRIFCRPGHFFFFFILIKELAANEMVEANADQKIIRKFRQDKPEPWRDISES